MLKLSAGLVVFRWQGPSLEVFLVHPGGPFWQKKDLGAWSIPKGEYSQGEEPIAVARREFEEETGFQIDGELTPLADIKQPSGKIISAWAAAGDFSAANIRSNLFSIEWPPKSGKTQEFPEVDRAEWFGIEEARMRITKGQVGFLEQIAEKLNYSLKSETQKPNDEADLPGQGSLFK